MAGNRVRACAVCGAGLPEGSRLYCSDGCRLRARREKYAAKRAAGDCVDCGRPTEKSLCPDCLRKRGEGAGERRRRLASRGLCLGLRPARGSGAHPVPRLS